MLNTHADTQTVAQIFSWLTVLACIFNGNASMCVCERRHSIWTRLCQLCNACREEMLPKQRVCLCVRVVLWRQKPSCVRFPTSSTPVWISVRLLWSLSTVFVPFCVHFMRLFFPATLWKPLPAYFTCQRLMDSIWIVNKTYIDFFLKTGLDKEVSDGW